MSPAIGERFSNAVHELFGALSNSDYKGVFVIATFKPSLYFNELFGAGLNPRLMAKLLHGFGACLRVGVSCRRQRTREAASVIIDRGC